MIWDKVLAHMACSKSADEAVAELELLHASRSLNRLFDELKQCQQSQLVEGSSSDSVR